MKGKVFPPRRPPLLHSATEGGRTVSAGAFCRFDELIRYEVFRHWPELDWCLIKCQVWQESAFNPKAVSPCGAIGLMQIMPATGLSLGLPREKLFIPSESIKGGVTYLKRQYEHFPEIPEHRERLKFALASYNGGRGYINQALALARKEDAPWQTWEGARPYLAKPGCLIGGKHPDHRQIIAYVARIWTDYSHLTVPATAAAQAGG